jgi:hypothetical protein
VSWKRLRVEKKGFEKGFREEWVVKVEKKEEVVLGVREG